MAANFVEKPTSIEDVLNELTNLKSVVTDAVEDGVKTAVKAIKQGRNAAYDAIDDARHTVKRKPFQTVGVVFAAGVLTGTLVAWLSSSRRD